MTFYNRPECGVLVEIQFLCFRIDLKLSVIAREGEVCVTVADARKIGS
jgi:hypothetical protein